jgi:glycosyltransferase involved in cell wall biosynthesis
MIIGIDGNEANVEEKLGVNNYAYEIINQLYRIVHKTKDEVEVVVFLKNVPREDMPSETDRWKYEILGDFKFWVLTRLTLRLLKSPKPDVFFAPNHYLPLLPLMNKVCTIHDLGYLKFSGQFRKFDFWQLTVWSAISIYISKYIISISGFTKKDIVRHYKIKPDKIKVVLHGYDKLRFNSEIEMKDVRHAVKNFKIKKNYILSIGALKPSKNLESLIKAYKMLKQDFKNNAPLLIMAGKKAWLYDSIFELVKEYKLENDVLFLGYLDEKYKPGLISGAKLLASPSYWEGFGMQVLESMACGTPVVVTKRASLPEVAGKAGVYCGVEPESIKNALRKVMTMSKKDYNLLKQKSIIQAKGFSWEKSGLETYNLLIQVGKTV